MATSKEEDHEELHVLMVAFSAQGHINPLLQLGNTLLSKGLHVTLATTHVVYHRLFASSSATSATVPASITVNGIQVLFFSDGFDSQEDRKTTNLDQYIEKLESVGPKNLCNLIKNHYVGGSKKLACIINNPFVPWVADVAEEVGIPCACVWIQPCALYAIYYRFYNEVNQFLTVTTVEDEVVELPGFPPLRRGDLPSFVLPSNNFGRVAMGLSEMFRDMKKLKWVLANSFYELEKNVIDSMADLCPILPVGPLVPPSLLTEDIHSKKIIFAYIKLNVKTKWNL